MAPNIWNIEEYTGDGLSCPLTPVSLPRYKKVGLFFFRFGICLLCVISSVAYSLYRAVRPPHAARQALTSTSTTTS